MSGVAADLEVGDGEAAGGNRDQAHGCEEREAAVDGVPAAELGESEDAEGAADEPADVPSDRDGAQEEPEGAVQHSQDQRCAAEAVDVTPLEGAPGCRAP